MKPELSGLKVLKDGLHKDNTLNAETARFELAIRFPVYTLSRRAPSTTRTRLLIEGSKNTFYNSVAEDFFCICCSHHSHFFNTHIFDFSKFLRHINNIAALISFPTERNR